MNKLFPYPLDFGAFDPLDTKIVDGKWVVIPGWWRGGGPERRTRYERNQDKCVES